MIDINLIPTALRKKSKALLGAEINLPRDVLLGVGTVFTAFLFLCHLYLLACLLIKNFGLSGYEAQWRLLESDKKAIDTIAVEVKDLNKKMKTAQELVSPRQTTWAQKLNILSDAVPKGVWLTKVIIDEKSLVVYGMAVSKQRNEIVLVGNLTSALKKDPKFAVDFSNIEVSALNRGKFNNVDVSQFTITTKLK